MKTTLENTIKIIFFDIDETLYSKSEQKIPDSITQEVLPQLKAKGIIPAIATGRCFSAFPKPLIPLLNEKGFEVFVTINGQHNHYKDTIISKYPLATEQIQRIITCFEQLNIEYAFVCHNEIAVSKNTPEVIEALPPIKKDYIVDKHYYKKEEVIQILGFYPQERYQDVVNSGLLSDDLKQVRWHKKSVDILNKKNSKANGIQDVLNYFNIDIKNAMAFGDGLNDLEMISEMGIGVAMGNGEEELKQRADYITKPILENGILFALKDLGIID